MTTLHDIKQALDSGETLVNGEELIWKANADQYFFDDEDKRPLKLNWETLVEYKFTTPSEWRIRDQIGAEPTIMAVPIDEWNALQEELKQLRQNQK